MGISMYGRGRPPVVVPGGNFVSRDELSEWVQQATRLADDSSHDANSIVKYFRDKLAASDPFLGDDFVGDEDKMPTSESAEDGFDGDSGRYFGFKSGNFLTDDWCADGTDTNAIEEITSDCEFEALDPNASDSDGTHDDSEGKRWLSDDLDDSLADSLDGSLDDSLDDSAADVSEHDDGVCVAVEQQQNEHNTTADHAEHQSHDDDEMLVDNSSAEADWRVKDKEVQALPMEAISSEFNLNIQSMKGGSSVDFTVVPSRNEERSQSNSADVRLATESAKILVENVCSYLAKELSQKMPKLEDHYNLRENGALSLQKVSIRLESCHLTLSDFKEKVARNIVTNGMGENEAESYITKSCYRKLVEIRSLEWTRDMILEERARENIARDSTGEVVNSDSESVPDFDESSSSSSENEDGSGEIHFSDYDDVDVDTGAMENFIDDSNITYDDLEAIGDFLPPFHKYMLSKEEVLRQQQRKKATNIVPCNLCRYKRARGGESTDEFHFSVGSKASNNQELKEREKDNDDRRNVKATFSITKDKNDLDSSTLMSSNHGNIHQGQTSDAIIPPVSPATDEPRRANQPAANDEEDSNTDQPESCLPSILDLEKSISSEVSVNAGKIVGPGQSSDPRLPRKAKRIHVSGTRTNMEQHRSHSNDYSNVLSTGTRDSGPRSQNTAIISSGPSSPPIDLDRSNNTSVYTIYAEDKCESGDSDVEVIGFSTPTTLHNQQHMVPSPSSVQASDDLESRSSPATATPSNSSTDSDASDLLGASDPDRELDRNVRRVVPHSNDGLGNGTKAGRHTRQLRKKRKRKSRTNPVSTDERMDVDASSSSRQPVVNISKVAPRELDATERRERAAKLLLQAHDTYRVNSMQGLADVEPKIETYGSRPEVAPVWLKVRKRPADLSATVSLSTEPSSRTCIDAEVSAVSPKSSVGEHTVPIVSKFRLDPRVAKALKKHQLEGVQHCWENIVNEGRGAILAHEMGLGKTMQTVATIHALMQHGGTDPNMPNMIRRALIVVPAKLAVNWGEELRDWLPKDSNISFFCFRKPEVRRRGQSFDNLKGGRGTGMAEQLYEFLRDRSCSSSENRDSNERIIMILSRDALKSTLYKHAGRPEGLSTVEDTNLAGFSEGLIQTGSTVQEDESMLDTLLWHAGDAIRRVGTQTDEQPPATKRSVISETIWQGMFGNIAASGVDEDVTCHLRTTMGDIGTSEHCVTTSLPSGPASSLDVNIALGSRAFRPTASHERAAYRALRRRQRASDSFEGAFAGIPEDVASPLRKYVNKVLEKGLSQDMYSKDVVDVLVVDEAHEHMNSPNFRRAIDAFPTCRRIFLSGTPMQNKLLELFHIVKLVAPRNDILGSREHFILQYDEPCKISALKDASAYDKKRGEDQAKDLFNKLKSTVMSRYGQDILKEALNWLPLTAVVVTLTERKLQAKHASGVMEHYKSLQKCVLLPFVQTARAAWVHPFAYWWDKLRNANGVPETKIEDLERYTDMLSKDRYGRRKNPLYKSDKELESMRQNYLTDLTLCPKLAFCVHLIANAVNANEKTIVFVSDHLSREVTLDVIRVHMGWVGFEVCDLHGSMTLKNRQKIIRSFQDPRSEVKVIVVIKKSGGVGINLSAASRVVLLDADWNPAIDMQAIARAYRLGQTRPVFAYRLVLNSRRRASEKAIFGRQSIKQVLCGRVVDGDSTLGTPFSSSEIAMPDSADLAAMFIIYPPSHWSLEPHQHVLFSRACLALCKGHAADKVRAAVLKKDNNGKGAAVSLDDHVKTTGLPVRIGSLSPLHLLKRILEGALGALLETRLPTDVRADTYSEMLELHMSKVVTSEKEKILAAIAGNGYAAPQANSAPGCIQRIPVSQGLYPPSDYPVIDAVVAMGIAQQLGCDLAVHLIARSLVQADAAIRNDTSEMVEDFMCRNTACKAISNIGQGNPNGGGTDDSGLKHHDLAVTKSCLWNCMFVEFNRLRSSERLRAASLGGGIGRVGRLGEDNDVVDGEELFSADDILAFMEMSEELLAADDNDDEDDEKIEQNGSQRARVEPSDVGAEQAAVEGAENGRPDSEEETRLRNKDEILDKVLTTLEAFNVGSKKTRQGRRRGAVVDVKEYDTMLRSS